MNKFFILGIVSCGSGLILWCIKFLSTLIEGEKIGLEEVQVSYCLADFINLNQIDWIGSIPWPAVRTTVSYIFTMPLYLLLFCIGAIFLIISTFYRK